MTVVTNCAVEGNSLEGISNTGTMTITGTTISGNGSSGSVGGGILNGGFLGSAGGTLTIVNSTIYGNTASMGGGIYNSGALIINNSTIGRNSASDGGGGLYGYSGTVTLGNTIVAQNANGTSPDISGAVAASYCLIGNTTGAGTISGTGNILNQDPLLAQLGSYGGPTQTMPLLAGSPGIDHGSNGLIASGVVGDQRGLYRIFNGTVDIGACEDQPTQDALIRQVSQISPATFDGTGPDVAVWLGDVIPGQQVAVYVGETLENLRPVRTFTNSNGDLPWLVPINVAGTGVPLAHYVAVGSDRPVMILSAAGLHPNLTDLSGYQQYTAVTGGQPQFQTVDYANVAKLYQWDWDTPELRPLAGGRLVEFECDQLEQTNDCPDPRLE